MQEERTRRRPAVWYRFPSAAGYHGAVSNFRRFHDKGHKQRAEGDSGFRKRVCPERTLQSGGKTASNPAAQSQPEKKDGSDYTDGR